jgi:hypothetical protein
MPVMPVTAVTAVTAVTDPRHALQSDEITRVRAPACQPGVIGVRVARAPRARHQPLLIGSSVSGVGQRLSELMVCSLASTSREPEARPIDLQAPAAPESRLESEEPLLNSRSRYPIP